jgi:hypothetical protein
MEMKTVRDQRYFYKLFPGAGTIVSLSLWNKEKCEGVLIIVFAQILLEGAPRVLIVEGTASLLAEALASARLHVMIEQQRQRFYTILDQLPGGVLLADVAKEAFPTRFS